jgi:hypothetical protein
VSSSGGDLVFYVPSAGLLMDITTTNQQLPFTYPSSSFSLMYLTSDCSGQAYVYQIIPLTPNPQDFLYFTNPSGGTAGLYTISLSPNTIGLNAQSSQGIQTDILTQDVTLGTCQVTGGLQRSVRAIDFVPWPGTLPFQLPLQLPLHMAPAS